VTATAVVYDAIRSVDREMRSRKGEQASGQPWSMKVRFAADSPLEEAVRSEPVSEMGFPK
jgi:hypothetical protein